MVLNKVLFTRAYKTWCAFLFYTKFDFLLALFTQGTFAIDTTLYSLRSKQGSK